MKLSDIKFVYTLVGNNLLYTNWTLKQNVNDFIEYIEAQDDLEWTRENREEFGCCLEELFEEYLRSEDPEEEEIEIILPWELKEQRMMELEYQKSVAL